jgi:hypothetical protein
VAQVATLVLSQDDKTITTIVRGVNAAGRQVNTVADHEKNVLMCRERK